jgi:ribosome maturation factor RimP
VPTFFLEKEGGTTVADLEAVRAAVGPVLSHLALELFDLELVGSGRARTLRLTVDRAEGLDLDALAAASERVSATLDTADVISGPYTLEVSSPGVERPLRRPDQFRRYVGTEVSVKSKEATSGARRHRGTLVEADDEGVVLDVEGERRRFPYEGIAQAKTVFEWGPAPKPGHGKGEKGRNRRGTPVRAEAAAAAGSGEPDRSEERLA